VHLGRGDRRGAARLAAFVFAAYAVAVFFGANHVPNFDELYLFLEFLAWGIFLSCFIWVLYIALEPYVRRRWPAMLVSWSRLLAGGFRDPLVGRDVLAGCLWGAFLTVVLRLEWFIPSWLGYAPPQPSSGPQWEFLGARAIISDISLSLGPVLVIPLAMLFVLVLLRALLRKEWAAAAAFVLLFTFLFAALSEFTPVTLVTGLIYWGLLVFLLIRFGLLAFAVQGVFVNLLQGFPLTTQGSAWYAGISLAGILLMAAMAFYGFYTSLGGRPVFGGATLEE
jgi:hypothetical protein